jgi:hypothetical protein
LKHRKPVSEWFRQFAALVCGNTTMRSSRTALFRLFSLLGLVTTLTRGDPKVNQEPMGPDGDSLGCSISPGGAHVAVLANQGSHLAVFFDGVAGPKIDALQVNTSAAGRYPPPTFWAGQVPIVYSDDGSHWAYMARIGDEYVVMADGRELARGPLTGTQVAVLPLSFSAKGHHLFYSDLDAAGGYHVVVDGKPGPAARILPSVVMSPDGDHYAYVGEYSNAGVGLWSFVDGRRVNYFGDHLQYSGRGNLVSYVNLPDGVGFVLNGKPEIKAMRIDPLWMSPDGAQIAMVVTQNQATPSVLVVNGKPVDGTQGLTVEKVYFSPDGKRWAALCDKKTGTKFMIIDGKKGADYATIPSNSVPSDNMLHWRYVSEEPNPSDFSPYQLPTPGFTADSSKFVYAAGTAGRQFVVIDENESNGYQSAMPIVPVLSTTGHRIAYFGDAPNRRQHLVVDGADTELGPQFASGTTNRLMQLTFSPDAAHFGVLQGTTLNVDGVLQPGVTIDTYVFSPAGGHVAYLAAVANKQSLVVDQKVVSDKAGAVKSIFFSPDGDHVYWFSQGNWASLGTKDSYMLFVDGKPATHFQPALNGYILRKNFSADGSLNFVALTDGDARRFHVSSETSLGALLAAAPPIKAK